MKQRWFSLVMVLMLMLGGGLFQSTMVNAPVMVSADDPAQPDPENGFDPDPNVNPPDEGGTTMADNCILGPNNCNYYKSDTSGQFCGTDSNGYWQYADWVPERDLNHGIPGLPEKWVWQHTYLGCKDFTNCNIIDYSVTGKTFVIKPWRSTLNPAKNMGWGEVKCIWSGAPNGQIPQWDNSGQLPEHVANTVEIVIKWFQVCIYQTVSNPDFWSCTFIDQPGVALAPGQNSWRYGQQATCWRNTTQGGVPHKTRMIVHYYEIIHDDQGHSYPRLDRYGRAIVWKIEKESSSTTLIKCTTTGFG